jgi:hypothetical protein
MTPAGWIAFASGLVTIVSALTCGWLGVTAFRSGKQGLGAAILAIPIVFSLGFPVIVQLLPLAPDLRFQTQLAGLVLTPAATVLALATSRRYLPQ